MSVLEDISKTNQGEYDMSNTLSNILLIGFGGVLLVGMFYTFFNVLFSKNKNEPTNKTEKKSTKPMNKNMKPKFIGRA